MERLSCDMEKDCTAPVSHVDAKGYAYCATHADQRKYSHRCRKLRAFELKRLERGLTISFEVRPTPRFTKEAPRLYLSQQRVCLQRADGLGSFEAPIMLRIDGRGMPSGMYRFDLVPPLGPPEARDDGEARSLAEAKDLARRFLAAVRDQATLNPVGVK